MPVYNKTTYSLLYPHYQKAISLEFKLKDRYQRHIIEHITTYYLWEFEELESDGLLFTILCSEHHDYINFTIMYLIRQKELMRNYHDYELRIKFEKLIFDLWSFLAKQYRYTDNLAVKENLQLLLSLFGLSERLEKKYIELFGYYTEGLIINHINLEFIGELKKYILTNISPSVAVYIANILNMTTFVDGVILMISEDIKELIVYLFNNNQRLSAEKLCDEVQRQGYDFVKPIIQSQQNNFTS